MSQVVTLNAQETAERLIPILRDYAAKLGTWNERAGEINERLSPNPSAMALGLEAARLVCLQDTLGRPILVIAQNASGLLEHAELESVTWTELKTLSEELEEHLNYSKIMAFNLAETLKRSSNVGAIRKQVEQFRYKAPF